MGKLFLSTSNKNVTMVFITMRQYNFVCVEYVSDLQSVSKIIRYSDGANIGPVLLLTPNSCQ